MGFTSLPPRLRARVGYLMLVLAGAVLVGAVAVTQPGVAESSAADEQAVGLPADHPIVGNPFAVADVAEAAGPAVVFIEVTYREQGPSGSQRSLFPDSFPGQQDWFWPFPQPGPREGSGSGFIISNDGMILTNQHLFSHPDQIESIRVTVVDHDEPFQAELIGSDFTMDLAILKIESNRDLPVAVLGDSDAIRVGEWVVAIGNPYRMEHTVTAGVLSATGRAISIYDQDEQSTRNYSNLMQTDAAINPGNSGGPLLNLRGEVIGINTAVSTRGQGIGFAIPINEATAVLDDLITRGMVVRPFIGIRYGNVDPEWVEPLELDSTDGIVIVEVVRGTAAAEAGLQAGDVVTHVNRRAIQGVDDFLEAIEGMQVGDVFLLTVIRDGSERLIRLEVAEMPAQFRPR